MNNKQCRMARAGLKWSVQDLADRSGVNKNTISRFERDGGSQMRTAEKIEKCFLATGKVRFHGADGVFVEPIGYMLIDLQTSPYSDPEDIQKEIDYFMQQEQTLEALEAIEELEKNLKNAKQRRSVNDQRN